MRLLVALFVVLAALQITPAFARSVNSWEVICGKEPGAIKKSGKAWIFTTNPNFCSGGVFKQRAEVFSGPIKGNSSDSYLFTVNFSMTTSSNEEFTILDVHDGRDGCSPPFQLYVRPDGRLAAYSDVKIGPGESCIRGTLGRVSSGRVERDGTEHELKVLLQFDGAQGFNVTVWLDGKKQLSGRYIPSDRPDAFRSEFFEVKHGVYSRNMFPFEMRSRDIRIRRVTVN